MTFVVARKTEFVVTAVCETRVMYNDEPQDDIVKIAIITPNIAIAFAGGASLGAEIVNNLPNDNLVPSDSIVDYFLEQHRLYLNDKKEYVVEFIVMFNKPTPALWSIKHGRKLSCEFAWIGHLDAYEAFRGFEAGTRNCPDLPTERYRIYGNELGIEFRRCGIDEHDANPTQRLIGWMRLVISDRRVVDAGGFCVAVNNRFGYFSYRMYSFLTTGEGPFAPDESGRLVRQPSEEQKVYAFSGLGSLKGSRQGVGFYFPRGPVGYLMVAETGYVLHHRVTYLGLSIADFCQRCKDEWGVVLPPFVLSLDNPANFAAEKDRAHWKWNPPS